MTYAIAWALCATAGCGILVGLVIVAEVRDHRAHQQARRQLALAEQSAPNPTPAPRIPAPRQPSAAVVVTVGDPDTFDDFLRELIATPHVEEALR